MQRRAIMRRRNDIAEPDLILTCNCASLKKNEGLETEMTSSDNGGCLHTAEANRILLRRVQMMFCFRLHTKYESTTWARGYISLTGSVNGDTVFWRRNSCDNDVYMGK